MQFKKIPATTFRDFLFISVFTFYHLLQPFLLAAFDGTTCRLQEGVNDTNNTSNIAVDLVI